MKMYSDVPVVIPTGECVKYVTDCMPFISGNISGIRKTETLYVVYSYGWFPLWACINGEWWYGHKEKYTKTTSKHQRLSKPKADNITYLNKSQDIRNVIAEYWRTL